MLTGQFYLDDFECSTGILVVQQTEQDAHFQVFMYCDYMRMSERVPAIISLGEMIHPSLIWRIGTFNYGNLQDPGQLKGTIPPRNRHMCHPSLTSQTNS